MQARRLGKMVRKSALGLQVQKPWIVPIPASRKLERLEENIGSLNILLTAQEINNVDHAMAKIQVVDDRY